MGALSLLGGLFLFALFLPAILSGGRAALLSSSLARELSLLSGSRGAEWVVLRAIRLVAAGHQVSQVNWGVCMLPSNPVPEPDRDLRPILVLEDREEFARPLVVSHRLLQRVALLESRRHASNLITIRLDS